MWACLLSTDLPRSCSVFTAIDVYKPQVYPDPHRLVNCYWLNLCRMPLQIHLWSWPLLVRPATAVWSTPLFSTESRRVEVLRTKRTLRLTALYAFTIHIDKSLRLIFILPARWVWQRNSCYHPRACFHWGRCPSFIRQGSNKGQGTRIYLWHNSDPSPFLFLGKGTHRPLQVCRYWKGPYLDQDCINLGGYSSCSRAWAGWWYPLQPHSPFRLWTSRGMRWSWCYSYLTVCRPCKARSLDTRVFWSQINYYRSSIGTRRAPGRPMRETKTLVSNLWRGFSTITSSTIIRRSSWVLLSETCVSSLIFATSADFWWVFFI